MKKYVSYSGMAVILCAFWLCAGFSSVTHFPNPTNPDVVIKPNHEANVSCGTGDIFGFYAPITSGPITVDVVCYDQTLATLSAPLSSFPYTSQGPFLPTNTSAYDPGSKDYVCLLSGEKVLFKFNDNSCTSSAINIAPLSTTAPQFFNGNLIGIDIENNGYAQGSDIDIEIVTDFEGAFPIGLTPLNFIPLPANAPYLFNHEQMSSATNGVDEFYFVSGSHFIIVNNPNPFNPPPCYVPLDITNTYIFYGLEYESPGVFLAIRFDINNPTIDLVRITLDPANLCNPPISITPLYDIQNNVMPSPPGWIMNREYYSSALDTCESKYYLSTRHTTNSDSKLIEIDLITSTHTEQIFPNYLFGLEMKEKMCDNSEPCTASFDVNFIDSCGHVQIVSTSTGPGPLTYQWCDGQSTANLDLQLPCGTHEFCVSVTCEDNTVATANITVNITDTIPPTIVCPPDMTVNCDDDFSPASTGFATATDNCPIVNALTYVDDTLGMLPCDALIQRTWTAEDWCNNTSSCIQNILVRDITPPVIINCPGNTFIQGTLDSMGICSANVTLVSPTASDNCSSVVSLTNNINNTNDASGIYPEGITQVTWTATDSCGNTSTCMFPVTVACDSCYCAPADLILSTTSGLSFPIVCNQPDPNLFPVLPCLSGDVTIMGTAGCNSSTGTVCPPDVSWMLSGPNGLISTGGGLSGTLSVTFPASLVSTPGTYTFVSLTYCPGALEACPCYVKWVQWPCSICCEDPMSFTQIMQDAVTATIENDSCKAIMDIGILKDCDYFESIDWGDGVVDQGPFNDNTQLVHTYAASGNYDIMMLAIELDTLDQNCFEAFINIPVMLTCTTSTSEDVLYDHSITLYPNPMIDKLSLERKGVELEEVRIIIRNMYGVVQQRALFLKGSQQHSLSLESLSSGVYIISIEIDSGVLWNDRFIKL